MLETGSKQEYMKYVSRYIDETFDVNNCMNYILSIQCSLDGFYFAVFDTTVNKFIVLSGLELNTVTPFMLKNEIEGIIASEPILQASFKQVKIAYNTHKAMLVPESLIPPGQYSTAFGFTFETSREETILTNSIGNAYTLLFAMPKIIKKQLEQFFPGTLFYSQFQPLAAYARGCSGMHPYLLVSMQNHSLQIAAIKEHKIVLINSFFVKDETDCLFYIMNTAKSLSFDLKSELVLFGANNPKSELVSKLMNYFGKVNFAHYSNNYAVSYTFLDEQASKHLLLLELALCE
jgi:hypothetical protein